MGIKLLSNPFRHVGLPPQIGLAEGAVTRDPAFVLALLERCPATAATPLRKMSELAGELGVGSLWIKDESDRMGLGSFKALGAIYAIARLADERAAESGLPATQRQLSGALEGEMFSCASAGNHGLSVATGARLFGAQAVIYLSENVPESFAARLRETGARVLRVAGDYAASMAAAADEAARNGWTLLSDSSWPGYTYWPTRVMEGYLAAAEEVCRQIPEPPTHVLLQAGVGGFAAAMTALFRSRWGDEPAIVVVEPDAAPALMDSVHAGRPLRAEGPDSVMGRLDCKEPSHLALRELAREADWFLTVEDEACEATVSLLRRYGVPTTPSGAAGLAALHHIDGQRTALGMDRASSVLAFVTEGAEERS